ncbi:LacI family DNA-binding transcriptional regulator [Jonesiaceae bacterium BS-20]|uniref:LacI family DNA-binding transcriptional regulator n=1 Tax=Jonesiaceae bacterium BS-20 TaxID=3120821 RepID=A0AAU7DW22_9MICO
MSKMASTTLADVAKLAGVSIATASKALNDKPQVKAETRIRVQAAAEQLDFVPNVLARSLHQQRTGTVGLITSDLEGRFSIPILMGAEDAFGAGSVSVFLCDARDDAIRERHHLRALLSRRVDGLIVVGSRPDPRESLGRDLGVPVVYAYAPSRNEEDASIVVDNFGAGRMAIEHLIACGRTKIAHITGDPSYGATSERAEGARSALRDHGLDFVSGAPLVGSWSEAWGRGATRMLLGQGREIDGIFCGSDQIARGALDILRESGRAVPEDVAVVGFDNWEVFAKQSRPQLTSVDMRLEELGSLAAKTLFNILAGEEVSGVQSIDCRLMFRESTAPLA